MTTLTLPELQSLRSTGRAQLVGVLPSDAAEGCLVPADGVAVLARRMAGAHIERALVTDPSGRLLGLFP